MTKDKKIAVVGAGIVGSVTAFYLSRQGYDVTIYDEGNGQATAAAAGIICPWLSRRRNKIWYRMARSGAAFYPQLMLDLNEEPTNSTIYRQTGTLIFKTKPEYLTETKEIAEKRREEAPEIGELHILQPAEIKKKLPMYEGEDSALFASGGARVQGSALTEKLMNAAKQNGATFHEKKVTLTLGEEKRYKIVSYSEETEFDMVVLAVGAWLPYLLNPLGFEVDIRPQKGQLLELQLKEQTKDWPVVMPEGEKDIIPFADGKVIVGATHENEEGYDIEPDEEKLSHMLEEARAQFPTLEQATITSIRVGTRAYTSDFAPFFGEVPDAPGLYAASGLGSSGLTTGPLIGRMLSQLISGTTTDLPATDYPIEKYIKKAEHA